MPPRTNAEMWEPLADRETGRLTRPMPTGLVVKPRSVVLEGDMLCYERLGTSPEYPSGYSAVPADLLDRLLRARGDSGLVNLAKRFGATGLKPLDGGYAPDFTGGSAEIIVMPEGEVVRMREPLAAWRWTRDFFAAVLALAAALQQSWTPHQELTERLSRLQPRELTLPDDYAATDGAGPALYIEWLLDFHVAKAQIRPRLMYGRGWRGRFHEAEIIFGDAAGPFETSSVFCALMLQAFSAIVGRGFTTCSHCGTVFVPMRTPAVGRRRYCESCRRSGQPLRDAKADYRAKLTAQKNRVTRRKRNVS